MWRNDGDVLKQMQQLQQLRKDLEEEEQQLWKEKEQLWEEKLILMRRSSA